MRYALRREPKTSFLLLRGPFAPIWPVNRTQDEGSRIKSSQALFLHNLLSSEASQYSEKWGEAEYDVDHFLMTLSNH